MKLVIGEYNEGRLVPGYNEQGDEIPGSTLQELKTRFNEQYREANIKLTEQQLLRAATPDQDIIQAVHSLENLDVILNSMGKYTTEWYELHHPDEDVTWDELALWNVEQPGLQELNAAVNTLMQARERIVDLIDAMMQQTMPNTAAVAGSLIGAKLLAASGDVQRMASMPATTIQLLGAEQALFRHLRNRNIAPPKHGLLFNHPLVQQAPVKLRGKMARTLANNISLASRVDFYKGEYCGDRLKQKVEATFNALARK